MTRPAHNSMPKHHRWMVLWLVLFVIGGQFLSTIVMAEEFLNAADVPCHTTGVDEAQPCPCCDDPMAMDCECSAQCGHGQVPAGITNLSPSVTAAPNAQHGGPPTTRYVECYSHPLLRPPIDL